MDSNHWLNLIPLFLSLSLTVGIGIYAWRHRQSPGITTFVFVMLAETFWIMGYIFELTSPGLEAKIFWDDVQFIGSMGTPLALLIFAYEYTGLQKELTHRIRVALAIIPVLFLILLFTNPLHGIVRDSSAWIEPGQPFDSLLYDFTLPIWVSFIYSYITYLSAMVFFIRNLMRQHRLFRTQTLIIIAGFVFPFLGSIPGVTGIVIFGQRDITPYTYGLANLIFAWGLFRYGLFDVAPIARDAVMEYMSDVVIVLDSQSRIVDVNPAALIGLSVSANQLIGIPISQVLSKHPDLLKILQQEQPIREEVEYANPDGKTYTLDAFISPLYDQHNRLIGRLLVARDITEQKQMETELRKAYETLELRVQQRTADLKNANLELESKNAELERFAYTVSHDLKSPLVTIRGFLGYLEEDMAAGNLERVKQDSKRIANAVDSMNNLLKDLLELSRIGRLMNPPEEVSFNQIAQEVLEILHGQLETRGVTVTLEPNLPVVYGDRQRLKEVLQNLIDNATKFMGSQPHPLIEIGVNKQDEKHIFFVKDNGEGIEPKYHDKIFKLFDKLNSNSEGTGIGLALVKRIVNVHNGEIWVESQGKGTGTTFYFTLPQKPSTKKQEVRDEG
jgi:PAS domain S-box-containing protein